MSHIFLKDVYDIILSPRLIISVLIVLLLTILSVAINEQQYQERLIAYAEADEGLNGYARLLHKPELMSILVNGVDASFGHPIYIFKGSLSYPAEDRSIWQAKLFDKIDLHWVFSTIMPLFAIIISFGSISDEKEKGTLKLLLVSGLNKIALLVGKLLARLFLIMIITLLSIVISFLYLSLFGSVDISFSNWLSVIAYYFTTIIYLGMYIAIGTTVSTYFHKSTPAYVASLLAWVLFVILLPSLLNSYVANVLDSESAAHNELKLIEKINESKVNLSSRVRASIKSESSLNENYWLNEARRDSASLSTSSYMASNRKERNNYNIYRFLSVMSPFSAYDLSAMRIFSVGPEKVFVYKDNILSFRNQLVSSHQNLSKLPSIKYDLSAPKNLMNTLVNTTYEWTILITYILLLLLISINNMSKYDVR